jgi:cysteine synthase
LAKINILLFFLLIFIPKYSGIGTGIIPPILDTDIYDEVVKVKSDDAIAMAKRMALEEGLLCGE